MKKVLMFFTMIILLLFPAVSHASFPSDQESQDVLDAIDDVKYTADAGADYRTFNDAVIKASIAYKRYSSKNPDSTDNIRYYNLIQAYIQARDVWKDKIITGSNFYDDTTGIAREYHIPVARQFKNDAMLDYYEAFHAIINYAEELEESYKASFDESSRGNDDNYVVGGKPFYTPYVIH